MPPTRQEYNAKARRSTAGTRKKGKLRKRKEQHSEDVDTNAEIVTKKPLQERELERRERLKQELHAQSDNWSSKKKKRLEKYIDKKLKKEERVLIFEKLAKSQNEVDSALLHSSSTLGSGKPSTHRERIEKDEDFQVRYVIASQAERGDQRLGVPDLDTINVEGSSDDDEEEERGPSKMVVGRLEPVSAKPLVEEESLSALGERETIGPLVEVTMVPTVLGSALRKNEDGSVVAPIVRRKPKKLKLNKWKKPPTQQTTQINESSASSNHSSDYSSSDEEEVNTSSDDGGEESEEGGGSEDEGSNNDVDGQQHGQRPKKLGFKEWATMQLSLAKGYAANPSHPGDETSLPLSPPVERPTKRRKMDESERTRGPMGEDLVLPATAFSRRVLERKGSEGKEEINKKSYTKHRIISRSAEVAEARFMLPIVAEEQTIMEAIMLNPVVIISGETGSGKTTQVPQFLYEAGFGGADSENPGIIGVTQPRRVAAISMANRVAHELSLTSSQVSYQIRYDATVSPSTLIKFMTDGVLLRELATDFLLKKYSVVIIDEAHERSINTDILIGVLSRVVKLREEMWLENKDDTKPLRLIIMSATLHVSDFAENKTLFSVPPPIISVAARQHPVTVHFSRRTSSDYVTEAIAKTSKIHARLPPGGILLFLTGQNEITGVCRHLEERYGRKALHQRRNQRDGWRPTAPLHSSKADGTRSSAINPRQAVLEVEDIDLDIEDRTQVDSDLDENTGDSNIEDLETDVDEGLNQELGTGTEETEVPMHIVPLYSLLPSEKQIEVFRPPPADARLVVVATNVAETSITIPGIKYVVDCGRAKERRYDVANGIQAFQVAWISKASAVQRAGRAGRTGPGHCYRLYSSALFEHHFQAFTPPEILRAPIEGVVLQMKNMHIDAVVNFPFPTPPDRFALHQAEKVLAHLGAIKKPDATRHRFGTAADEITELGRTMALFPLSPRYSRMLAAGQHQQCLPYIISIVSAMSVGDPFLFEEAIETNTDGQDIHDSPNLSHLTSEKAKTQELKRLQRKAYFQIQHKHASLGDFTSDILKILSAVGAYEYHGGGHDFCSNHFLRFKAMEEIHKLRVQVGNIMHLSFPEVDPQSSPKLPPPSKIQIKVIKQLITAAFIDQVAVRKDLIHQNQTSVARSSGVCGVPYRAVGIIEDVFLHPSSVLAHRPPPDYIVFQEVIRTTQVFVKGLTVVNPAWLSSLGKSMCTYSKPFKRADGTLMTTPRFGPEGWELPAVKVEGLRV